MKKWIPLLCALLLLTACVKIVPAPAPTDAPTVTEAPKPAQAATEAPQPIDAPSDPTDVPANPTEAPAAPTDAPQEADLAFSTVTLSGEELTSNVFSDYDLVIINFWAEWCGPCVGEMPALEQIHQEYPNVLIVGAWCGDSVAEALLAIKDAGVTYPAVKIDTGLYTYATRSMYIPATYFFDGNGNEIGEPVIGGMDYHQWKATVEALLP